MYDKRVRTNKANRTNNLGNELIWGMKSVTLKKIGVSLRQENDIAVMYIFNKKMKCCNHRCPDSVYFNTLLLSIYLSAIETLVCLREMSLTGTTSFGFAQKKTIHDF